MLSETGRKKVVTKPFSLLPSFQRDQRLLPFETKGQGKVENKMVKWKVRSVSAISNNS